MPYNSDIHHRQSIRQQHYDYTRSGAYFVTICAYRRECRFGAITDGAVRLNALGEVIAECWNDLPIHFADIELDAFVVMPNHLHGIVVLDNVDASLVGARHASPDFRIATETRARHASPLQGGRGGVAPRSIGAIVGSFKSAVTRRINLLHGMPGVPIWQRNYYEHIIRNESDLATIRQYIVDNPAKWATDKEFPLS